MSESHTVTLARKDYEKFVELSKLIGKMFKSGVQAVIADIDGQEIEFDPVEDLDEFAAFMNVNPHSRPNFVFEWDIHEVNQITDLTDHCDNIDTEEAIHQLSEGQFGEANFDVERDIGNYFASENLEDVVDLSHTAQTEDPALLMQEYQAAVAKASDPSQLGCERCNSSHLVKEKDLVGVSLKYTQTPPQEMASCFAEKTVCKGCGLITEIPRALGARKDAYCELIANRLKLDQHIDRREIYMLLSMMNASVNLHSSFLVEMLATYCDKVLMEPGVPYFDEDDIFTGSFILDMEDEFMVEVFDSLLTLGFLQHVGGFLYRPSRKNEIPSSPFEDLLMDHDPGPTEMSKLH